MMSRDGTGELSTLRPALSIGKKCVQGRLLSAKMLQVCEGQGKFLHLLLLLPKDRNMANLRTNISTDERYQTQSCDRTHNK